MHDGVAESRILRLGTRGSLLARWQAEWVAAQLRTLGHSVELVEISTRGDTDAARSVDQIGTRGVFTKEIQRALSAGDVDLGVHSLKDLPTEPVEGLSIAAVPRRDSAADVLVAKLGATVQDLPQGARVGTGSLRRQSQLKYVRPDLTVEDIRGNVDTRLRKLDEGRFDAIVLAEAGLRRLGLSRHITQVLPYEWMLPAVGQGALAVECRAGDAATRAAVAPLDDFQTHTAVTAERTLLAHLRGGCMAPVGALGQFQNDALQLLAVVLSADGSRRLAAQRSVIFHDRNDAEQLGRRVAEDLLKQGAAELILASRVSASGPTAAR